MKKRIMIGLMIATMLCVGCSRSDNGSENVNNESEIEMSSTEYNVGNSNAIMIQPESSSSNSIVYESASSSEIGNDTESSYDNENTVTDVIIEANEAVQEIESETELSIVDTYEYSVDISIGSIEENESVEDFVNNVYKVYGYTYTDIVGLKKYDDEISGSILFDDGDEYADFSIYNDEVYAMLYSTDDYINDSDSIKELANAISE